MKIGVTERGDAAVNAAECRKEIDRGGYSGAILITKNPKLLYEQLEKTYFDIGIPYVINCTITGFGGSSLEPGVISAAEAIDYYRLLVQQFDEKDESLTVPSNRVVLRIDPIIPTERGIATAEAIAKESLGRTRISIFDYYSHVRKRFKDADKRYAAALDPIYGSEFHAPLVLRQEVLNRVQEATRYDLPVEVCGEPGFKCTGCVSQLDLDAMGLKYDGGGTSGQRAACACLAVKQELLSNRGQCKHGCLYCYWK
jgi:hypothetical protein